MYVHVCYVHVQYISYDRKSNVLWLRTPTYIMYHRSQLLTAAVELMLKLMLTGNNGVEKRHETTMRLDARAA